MKSKITQETGTQELSAVLLNGGPIPVNGATEIDLDMLAAEPTATASSYSVLEDFDLKALEAPSGPEVPTGPDLSEVTVKRPHRLEVIYVHPDPKWRIELYIIPSPNRRDDITHLVQCYRL